MKASPAQVVGRMRHRLEVASAAGGRLPRLAATVGAGRAAEDWVLNGITNRRESEEMNAAKMIGCSTC